MPVRGLLRALVLIGAVAGAAAYALHKLGLLGDDADEAIEYVPASDEASADDGEDESADE